MAATIRYEPDTAGTNELMNSPEMVALMLRAADAAKPYAISLSPVETGRYAASFETSAHPHGGPKGDRAEGILANTAPYAWQVEWKNRDDAGGEGHHVLGKTIDFIEAGSW